MWVLPFQLLRHEAIVVFKLPSSWSSPCWESLGHDLDGTTARKNRGTNPNPTSSLTRIAACEDRTGRRESDKHKKDIAPGYFKHVITRHLSKNEPKTNPILMFKTTASSNIRKRSGQSGLMKSWARARALPAQTTVRAGGWLSEGNGLPLVLV
jgi:hypothetical protein